MTVSNEQTHKRAVSKRAADGPEMGWRPHSGVDERRFRPVEEPGVRPTTSQRSRVRGGNQDGFDAITRRNDNKNTGYQKSVVDRDRRAVGRGEARSRSRYSGR